MPFLRFSRDKRGYEHTYLIHAAQRKGAPARVLYWYRTPPGVRVGRPAFDDEVRRTLEDQYPAIEFDWPSLLNTSFPPAEVEHWRERRRAEKAAKQARQAAERDDALPVDEDGGETAPLALEVGAPTASFVATSTLTLDSGTGASLARALDVNQGSSIPAEATAESDGREGDEGGHASDREDDGDGEDDAVSAVAEARPEAEAVGDGSTPGFPKKRRRRGGRRRRRPGLTSPSASSAPPMAEGPGESTAAPASASEPSE